MSAETWSLIAVMLGTGATILIGIVGVMLKLWGETNKRLDRQDERIETLDASLRAEIRTTNERIEATNERIEASNASLRAEIHALRTESNQRFAQIEQRFIQIEQQLDRLAERQHADISAVNARLDALVLSQGSLAAALAPAPGQQQAPPHAAPPEPAPAST